VVVAASSPDDDDEPATLLRLELDVAEAASAAARAVAVTGAYISVAGLGLLDPIANWSLVSSPKALIAPHDVQVTAATVRGHLRIMIGELEVAPSRRDGAARGLQLLRASTRPVRGSTEDDAGPEEIRARRRPGSRALAGPTAGLPQDHDAETEEHT
jgi:hypothetical protein